MLLFHLSHKLIIGATKATREVFKVTARSIEMTKWRKKMATMRSLTEWRAVNMYLASKSHLSPVLKAKKELRALFKVSNSEKD